MGFYSIYKIFKDIFRTIFGSRGLRLILFVLVFLFIVLFFNKDVFASTYSWAVNDPFTSSDVSQAESKVGSNEWNADDEDIILCYIPSWGSFSNTDNMKAVVYWKVDTSLTNCAYYVDTNTLYTTPNTSVNCFDFCLANLSNGNIGITNYVRKSWARYQNVTEGNWSSYNNVNNVGWYSVYSTKVGILESGGSTNNVSGLAVQNINGIYNIFIKAIKTHYDFVDSDGNVIIPATNPLQTSPFIENQSTTIENWSFDYLNIDSGSVGYVYYDDLLDITSYADLNLKYTYDGITYSQIIPSGFLGDWSDSNFTLSIPKTWLLSNVNIQNGKTVDFYLEVKKQNVSDNIYYLGTYTLSLTSAEQEQIQQASDKALQGEILQSQQETNNKLDTLDNTINNSNVDFSGSDLPSDSTQDITADGVNGIFTSIYNAFCVGNAQDIVFPIPFTNKNITINANYVSQSLTNANATFIITIIQAFWWYLISRFIIKDVMDKINKIKGGNIENIETTNIRGDML